MNDRIVSAPRSQDLRREDGGLRRANVLGVGIHTTNMRDAVERISRAVESATRGYVCLTGVHGVMEARRDPKLRRILNRALLNLPDGMPMVWVGRLQKLGGIGRVFGPDLMNEVCRLSAQRGYTHFLYGGKVGVAEELEARLTERFPGLRIVGSYAPPFRPLEPEEAAALRDRIARLRPDILWVGLSTPKQERFMSRYAEVLDAGLLIGVGAAFDYHTDRIQDAPEWVKRSGLQWLHRLLQDPGRLWQRYATSNPSFLLSVALQAMGVRRFRLEEE